MYTLRSGTRQDAPAIIALMHELAVFEHLEDLFSNSVDKLHETLFSASGVASCLVIEHQGRVVAYAVYFYTYSTFLGQHSLYLEDLYVTPEHRRQGLGQRLLKHLAKLAVEKKCGRFEWSVLDWNQNAIDLYQKLGADVLPDWRVVRMTGDRLNALADQATD